MRSRALTTKCNREFAPWYPPSHSRMFGSGLMYQDELHEISNVSKQLREQRFQSRSSSQACRALKPTSIRGSHQEHISVNEYPHSNQCLQPPNFASGIHQTLYDSEVFNLHADTRPCVKGYEDLDLHNPVVNRFEDFDHIRSVHMIDGSRNLNPTDCHNPFVSGFRGLNPVHNPLPSCINEASSNTSEVLAEIDHSSPRLARTTYPFLLRFCGSTKALSTGKHIHDHIVRYGHEKKPFLSNLVLQMYCECGSMRDAWKVFLTIQKRDLFSWNFMIKACSRLGLGNEALRLFAEMQKEALIPDHFIWASAVSACASQVANIEGKRLHACVAGSGSELDCVLGTALINLYGKCGRLDEAQRAFDGMQKHDLVAWTSLISACLQEGKVVDALKLYGQMQREGIMPDRFLVTSILAACASQGSIDEGKEMHANIRRGGFESDVVIGNALIDMYGKCSSLEDAEEVFRNIFAKNVVSWNALFVAFTENGKGVHALKLFDQMQQEGVKPDAITYIIIFSLCASLGAMMRGKTIHKGIVGTELESDIDVRASIINMYGRLCNGLDALDMFNKSPKQCVSLWNAFLAAHAHSGRGRDAVQLFQQMLSEGILPNKFTFACLLYACGRAGLVDEGHGYFELMTRDYGISPRLEHYNCKIYILGRAGRLSEAMNFIGKMGVEPDIESWLILLGACRNHVDVKRGRSVAKHLFELMPNHAAPHVMLFHLYLAAERDADAADVLKLMRDNKELKMIQGSSSIEVKGFLHIFSADDQSHPQKEEIYTELSNLNAQVADMGLGVSRHALREALEGKHRDEMIAVTFGLITTASRTRIFVTKSSRMCSECHTVLKHFSQVTDREIVVRDADCFHDIKDGVCSCADYW